MPVDVPCNASASPQEREDESILSRDRAQHHVERLLELLDTKLQSSSQRIGDVELAIGRYSGFFRDLRRPSRRGSIRVVDLVATLDHLEIDPAIFFAEALESDLTVLPKTCGGKPPALVERARRRASEEGGGSLDAAYLSELDGLRYRDPERVLRLLEDAVDFMVPEAIPRLLGVAGSAWRMQLRLNEAEHAFVVGLEIARKRQDSLAEGDLLQRSGYMHAAQGNYRAALLAAREAALTFLLAGDLERVGRTLVDQGMFNVYLGKTRAAIEAYGAALSYLGEGDVSNRFSAYQGLGVAHEALGELEEASLWVSKALELGGEVEKYLLGNLHWLQGTIALRLDRLDVAERAFREAIEAFQGVNAADTALVTIELVRLLLQDGRAENAYETAASMLRLLEPLRRQRNRVISAAIADLLRHGRRGFDLALVQKVARLIREERGVGVRPHPKLQ